ncbi:hypothetical protein [Ralstonia wenshanensis]|uniref:Uncharacterized protein n=1 Tax=Ralstonia wenshanensis TaxID=2842456 RepID=A0AAD2B0T4_9RALS|nr:hypothetical protein [Ralstonia wenshanensis]CAJ0691919.1 hypothetical protein LMG18091_01527 [Ralstonia wenshanensis]
MNKLGAYKKKEKNVLSVQARHDLLIAALNDPSSVKAPVVAALSGQRKFAKFSVESAGISPISLNTLKSLANELYPLGDEQGNLGFAYLDSMRLRLNEVLQKKEMEKSSKRGRKPANEERTQLLSRLAATERQCILRSKAYLDLYSKINTLVRDGTLEEVARLKLFNLLDVHSIAFANLFSPDISDGQDAHSSIAVLHRGS